jgi:hypothetical protein
VPVPPLCVRTPPGALRVPPYVHGLNTGHFVTRSVTGCIPTRSMGMIGGWTLNQLVPTLCVGMSPGTLRVPLYAHGLNTGHFVTRSFTGCIPTRSVGTIRDTQPARSHALRGNVSRDAPRPALCAWLEYWALCDAELHGLHSHAERGNDQGHSTSSFPRSAWECLLGRSASRSMRMT